MINNIRTPLGPESILTLVAMLILLLLAGTGSASAQAPTSTVSINSYSCPPDYDQVSDCTKIGNVSVRVIEDGQQLADVTTVPESPVEVDVMWGAWIEVQYLAGAPTGSTLEATTLTFDAAEGGNPVTLVFVREGANDADGDGLSDADEAAYGTDPNNADSDEDGVQDGGEINAGTDPLDVDSDDDGYSDFDELERGSDPLDPASFPVDAEPNSVMVTMYTCPEGYDGKDHWTDCREPAAGVDVIFALWASEFAVTATTDASGTVSFTDLGSGEYRLIEETDDLGFTLGRSFVHCNGEPVSPDAPEPRQVALDPVDASTYGLTLTSGEEITCTWFNIPAADGDTDPAPSPTPGSPVKQLPSTGSGTRGSSERDDGTVIIAGIVVTSLVAGGAGIIVRRTH